MASKRPRRSKDASASAFSAFRPVLDRAVFAVALLGMLTAAHLYIQQGRGFDRGCLGFSAPQAVSEGCAAVTQSDASLLLGVSNAVWGFGFYLVVAGLSLALLFAGARRFSTLKRIRAGLIGVGFLYSLYLVYYQAAEVGEYCVLCLISAGLVLTLFVLQAIDYYRPSDPSTRSATRPMPPTRSREVTVMGTLAVLVVLLIGADFAYFNSLDAAAASPDRLVLDGEARPAGGDGLAAAAPEECGYDPAYTPVSDYRSLVSPVDPYKGQADAPVTVIEFFDPNCPHCRTLYPIMQDVAAMHDATAVFVYKPFVLWQHSVAQSAALYAAAQEGKFFDMLELQFANQQPRGLSAGQLATIGQHIGMNPEVLMQRVQSGIYNSMLQQNREAGERVGIRSVPMLLINGRVVGPQSKTRDCLDQLIRQAANN